MYVREIYRFIFLGRHTTDMIEEALDVCMNVVLKRYSVRRRKQYDLNFGEIKTLYEQHVCTALEAELT